MSVANMLTNNHPTLGRKDLMSLSTITFLDEKTRPFKKMDTSRDWSTNLYNLDIRGTAPKKFGVFTDKIDFINKVDDIDRTNSKILHYPLNKPEYNLNNHDIEKSTPNMGNLRTVRCTNPLEPIYNLPKFEEFPMDPPKFIRNSIEIDDIDGTKPRKYTKWETRETFPLDNHGIVGSKTKKKYTRNTKYENIDYSDLAKDYFRTNRHVNPLDPVYDFKNPITGESYQHGLIEKSKPQTIYPFTHPEPFGLKVDDIKGTNVGSRNYINKFNSVDYNLNINDIRGTSTGTLKKGITTTRSLHPLQPLYQYIGNKELGNDYNLYGKSIHQTLPNKLKTKFKKQKTPTLVTSQTELNVKVPNEEQKNLNTEYELGFNDQNYKIDKVVFNEEDYKKPKPYYGLIHDQYVCSSQNPSIRAKIEKQKEEHFLAKTLSTMTNGFTSSKYPSKNTTKETLETNNNIPTTCATQSVLKDKVILNNSSATNLANSQFTKSNELSMNKTISSSHFPKMSYAQQLDKFMDTNKLKFI